MRVRVLPYKQGSKSARVLADALGGRVLRVNGDSRFIPRRDDVLINWGSSRRMALMGYGQVANDPGKVGSASNKLNFFNLLRENHSDIIPEFWTNRSDIPEDAYPVVCRTVLNGHSGEGIVIANDESELVNAPLYTKYIKKKDEYRIHVGTTNQIISVQRKARRRDTPDEDVNWLIRNHKNGFVFVRNGVVPPEVVTAAAIRALDATGLDFGAVDVIYHERENRAYVLEVNTAPGLEGSTVNDYVKYFKKGEQDVGGQA